MGRVIYGIIGLVASICLLCIVGSMIVSYYVSGFIGGYHTDGNYRYDIVNGSAAVANYIGDEEYVIIPSEINGKTVKYIENEAFADNRTLQRAILPDSIYKIGEDAFKNCTNLELIFIPQSVEVIENDAFRGCDKLTIYAEHSNALSSWNKDWNSSGCTVVWNSDDSYDDNSGDNEGAQNGDSSEGDTDDGVNGSDNDFNIDDCEISYTNSGSNNDYSRGIIIEKYKGTGVNIVVPNEVNGTPIVEIEDKAFAYNNSIESITIPDSVIELGEYAFYEATKLKEVKLGEGITELQASVFAKCYALKTVKLGSKTTEINDYAFRGCSNLQEIELPNQLKEIGSYAFGDCVMMENIHIPISVKSLGMRVFSNCDRLEITVEASQRPEDWDLSWNPDKRPVKWGEKRI